MLVEKVIGKLNDYQQYNVEYVDIEWHECHKKINKKKLASGEAIGIRLDEHDAQHGLQQDDVLAVVDKLVYAVNILPTPCLVINVPNANLIPKVCYEIGNRHAPFYNGDNVGQFCTPYDKPIQVMLEKLGVNVVTVDVKLTDDKSISSTAKGHGHDSYGPEDDEDAKHNSHEDGHNDSEPQGHSHDGGHTHHCH